MSYQREICQQWYGAVSRPNGWNILCKKTLVFIPYQQRFSSPITTSHTPSWIVIFTINYLHNLRHCLHVHVPCSPEIRAATPLLPLRTRNQHLVPLHTITLPHLHQPTTRKQDTDPNRSSVGSWMANSISVQHCHYYKPHALLANESSSPNSIHSYLLSIPRKKQPAQNGDIIPLPLTPQISTARNPTQTSLYETPPPPNNQSPTPIFPFPLPPHPSKNPPPSKPPKNSQTIHRNHKVTGLLSFEKRKEKNTQDDISSQENGLLISFSVGISASLLR